MSHQPLPPPKLKQSQYIVAHLDFLGAQDMMRSEKKRDWLLEQMKEIYTTTADLMKDAPQVGKPMLETRIFSDNIIFVHKITTGHITFEDYQYVAWWAAFFQSYALLKNLVLRGGISFGKFCCDKMFVYGEALAKAYEIESKRAIYPRIIVDHNFFKNAHFTGEIRAVKENTFFKDTDGEWCVNFVSPAVVKDSREESQKILCKIRSAISEMYYENKNNPQVKQKYYWLINKFNELVKRASYEQCAIPSTIYDEPDTTTVLLKRGKV